MLVPTVAPTVATVVETVVTTAAMVVHIRHDLIVHYTPHCCAGCTAIFQAGQSLVLPFAGHIEQLVSFPVWAHATDRLKVERARALCVLCVCVRARVWVRYYVLYPCLSSDVCHDSLAPLRSWGGRKRQAATAATKSRAQSAVGAVGHNSRDMVGPGAAIASSGGWPCVSGES